MHGLNPEGGMSPTPQCTKKTAKRCLFHFTNPQSAGINSNQRTYSKPQGQGSPMPCKEIRLYLRYPSKTARKTIPLSPRNFPPRHQVSSRAQNMSSVPEQRTSPLNGKLATCKEEERDFKRHDRIDVRCEMT